MIIIIIIIIIIINRTPVSMPRGPKSLLYKSRFLYRVSSHF